MSDSDQYDFFVSYSRADNTQGWVSGFVEALLAEHRRFTGGDPARELKPFFDKKDIRNFDDWQTRLNDGLAKSRLFLAFVSPSYFASEWCRREWRAWIDTEISKHILSAGASPIYFVEVPGFVGKIPGLAEQASLSEQEVARRVAELCGLPQPCEGFVAESSPVIYQMRARRQVLADFVKPFSDEGLAALRRTDLQQVLERLAQDLDERVAMVRRAAESVSNVPPYNKRFSGRQEELLTLRDRLKDDRSGVICGVHGLGGVGKTELAFTYAHAFAHAYPGGRFHIPCDGKTSLQEAILALGDFYDFYSQISDEDRKNPQRHFAAIRRCLEGRLVTHGHILLVLDNVTKMNLVTAGETSVLTSMGPKMHLLATTRELPPSGSGWVTLGELPEADALALLEKHRPFVDEAQREAALTIVRRLGGFTLAVELVGAFLSVSLGSSYTRLAPVLGLEDLEEFADMRVVNLHQHNHVRRLSAILGPMLRELPEEERRVLDYAALLPPDCVALPWLKELVSVDFPKLTQPDRREDIWIKFCQKMFNLALFSRADSEATDLKIVRIHRLVQDLLRQEMAKENTLSVRQQEVNALIGRREAALQEVTQWEAYRWELEPIESLAYLWAENQHADAPWLMHYCAYLWNKLAKWNRAEPLLRISLKTNEVKLGNVHPAVVAGLNDLAQLLQATNRMSEAEPMMRRALAINEACYGRMHPEVATPLSNLAQLLLLTNRTSEAEPMMRRALAINETCYGGWHPNVARDLNNLAQLLVGMNRLEEAEPMIRRALIITESNYGANHHEVATRVNNLAHIVRVANKFDEAESLMRRALSIDEAVFGLDHPNVAIRLCNLAQLLQDTNRLEEAERLMRRSLVINEDNYGVDHHNVARDLSNLAWLLQDTNRLIEAEPLVRRALAIDKASFGENHPNVAIRLNNLALLLQDTNRSKEAEVLMRQGLLILLHFTDATGHFHPNLEACIENYEKLLLQIEGTKENALAKINELLSKFGIHLN